MNLFVYPVKLIKQPEGGFTVIFPDLPEAITQGETQIEALNEAADCLEEAIVNRMDKKLKIPVPNVVRHNKHSVSLYPSLAEKTAIYVNLQKQYG